MNVLVGILCAAGTAALLPVLYLLVLTVAAFRGHRSSVTGRSGPGVAPGVAPARRLAVVVPAHDEAGGIGETVADLYWQDYPTGAFEVFVVADNCTDTTAEEARRAGATVIERRDTVRCGKGYALRVTFDRLLADPAGWEGIVVVDADSRLSRDFLRRVSRALDGGARAFQGHYAVLNPDASWRTRLLMAAFASVHLVRPLGRSVLGLSAGLKGNGMAFRRDLLAEVPWDAFGVVEDLEYAITLARAGERVTFDPGALVYGAMEARGEAARDQRVRWEGGRAALVRAQGLPLLRSGVLGRKALLLDAAAELLVPPLAVLAALLGAGLATATLLAFLGGSMLALLPWALGVVGVGIHVAGGLHLTGAPWRYWAVLVTAPVFVAWKAGAYGLIAAGHNRGRWVRTARSVRA